MKPKLTKKAIAMINKALVLMLQHPHNYNQGSGKVPRIGALFCGSTGCIYGFFGLAAKTSKRWGWDLRVEVDDILGQEHGFSKIWYEMGWPVEYQILADVASTDLERALVAVARVRHWMRTGE